jgi:hypothetical protein
MLKSRRFAVVQAAAVIGLVVLPLLSGCLPAAQTAPPHTPLVGAPAVPSSAAGLALDDGLVPGDPSAARLHDILGAILNYYAHNHNRLPDTLDEIKPFADFATDLNLTSPSSGLPYVYSPGGLLAGGLDQRIIVWDPVPNKQGIRWCIVMPHIDPNAEIVKVPEVDPIPEKTFEAFVPPIQ